VKTARGKGKVASDAHPESTYHTFRCRERVCFSIRLIHTVKSSSREKCVSHDRLGHTRSGTHATQTPFRRHLNPINSCRRIVTVGFNVPKLIKPGPTVQGRFHSQVPACSRKFGKRAIECSSPTRTPKCGHARTRWAALRDPWLHGPAPWACRTIYFCGVTVRPPEAARNRVLRLRATHDRTGDSARCVPTWSCTSVLTATPGSPRRTT